MNYPKRILALDFETTGLSSMYDYITEVGAAVMDDGEIVDCFTARIQPGEKFKLDSGAIAIQAGDLKTPEGREKVGQWLGRLFEAPVSREVAVTFVEWLKRHEAHKLPIVAHNAPFDTGFLNQWIFQQRAVFGKEPQFSPVSICTMALAKLAYPGGGSYNLDAVAALAGLPPRNPVHAAASDAVMAGKAYFALVKTLEGVPA